MVRILLTSMLGRAFVRGLQGDDPKYLKAAACAKHFAVHSGPEPSRHSDNFSPSSYDLWDTYLPALKNSSLTPKLKESCVLTMLFMGSHAVVAMF